MTKFADCETRPLPDGAREQRALRAAIAFGLYVVEPVVTPDGRYIVVRGRLWRRSNPALPEARRTKLIEELMQARRDLRRTGQESADFSERRASARARVQAAKEALGERGPVWWNDGAPDQNRRMAVNTPYRDWFLAKGCL